jgi:hypothetical protein
MVLVNVRLDAADARRVKALRDAGVAISTLVRDAIRAEYELRHGAKLDGKKPSQVVAEILAALPDEAARPSRRVDAGDRRALQRHVAAKLRGRR